MNYLLKSFSLVDRFLLLFMALVVISCSNDELTLEVEEANSNSELVDEIEFNDNYASSVDDDGKCEPEVKVKFIGKLHRGRRWSERNNVKPCTASFGLCNMKFAYIAKVKCKNFSVLADSEPSVEPSFSYLIFEGLDDPNSLRVSLPHEPEDYQNDIFISSEGDDIPLSPDIAEALGIPSSTVIIANDYQFTVTSDYPFGYVDLQVTF